MDMQRLNKLGWECVHSYTLCWLFGENHGEKKVNIPKTTELKAFYGYSLRILAISKHLVWCVCYDPKSWLIGLSNNVCGIEES